MQELYETWLVIPDAFKLYIGIVVVTFLGLLGYVIGVFAHRVSDRVKHRSGDWKHSHSHNLRHQ